MDKLYEKDRFENRNILYLFNRDIIEYDIKSAGINVAKEFKLLPKDTIRRLESYGKERRNVEEGKIKASNPDYAENSKEAFKECRRMFIEENNLERDDIISIRRDAIWTAKPCRFTEFGKYIRFVEKQRFTSFIRLDKHLEIFYSPHGLHVSGMSDDIFKLHEPFMGEFIFKWFKRMETDEPSDVIRFTRRFIDSYKRRELSVGYYRTFDNKSKIILNTGESYDNYWEDRKDDIDILYNYFNVLIRLIKIPL